MMKAGGTVVTTYHVRILGGAGTSETLNTLLYDFSGSSFHYNADYATGRVLETVDFVSNSCDPHGLALWNGKLISCDAGIHPGWPNRDSPTAGWIFQIDFVN